METKKKWEIIGFGNIAVDDLLFVHYYPQSNTKNEVIKRLRQGGGLAGTAMVAASRLGAKTAYCGVLGDDELSEFTIQEFEKEGVSTALCFNKTDAQPIHSTIIIDQSNSDRTVFYTTEGFQPPAIVNITSELIGKCELVFMDSYILDIVPHLLHTAHQHNIPVIADVETDEITRIPNTLDEIDYLIFSMDLAAKITGEIEAKRILSALQTPRRRCTVITAGREGCWFMEKNNSSYHFPAYKVDEVDTTGCGDVFHGAFAAAVTRKETVSNCIIQASAAAAIKATQAGGRSGIPDLKTLLAFIRETPNIVPIEVV